MLMPQRLSLSDSLTTSGRTSDFGDPSSSRSTRPISNVQDTRLHSNTGSQSWSRSFWGRCFKSKANKGSRGGQSLSRSVTIKIDTPPVLRDSWMGRVDCSISLIAAAVGLGNLTHFPYLTHEHGAGVFLFPYILNTVVVGVPLFYLEACLGQLSGQGAVLGWNMAPLFKGVGLSIGLTCAVLNIYYSVLCTYPLFYFGSSFISPLPWAHCNNSWNTKECIYVTQCNEHSRVKLRNGTCVSLRTNSSVGMWNATAARHSTGQSYIFSSHEYWLEKVEGRGEEGGLVQAHLVLCLFVVWVLCFIGLVRGVISLCKIMVCGVLVMVLVLLVLVFSVALLPHGLDSMNYFLTPKWDSLANYKVWFDACGETFFGAVIGTGIISTMTSYSRYSAGNPLRMSIAVVTADVLTSVVGAFVFFKRVAYLNNQLGEAIETVTKFKGAKLAYIIYPESILHNRMGPFLSVLFFLALSGIGITSQVAFVHVLTTALFDKYPWMAKRRALALFVFCLLGFLVALPFTVKGGSKVASLLSSIVGPFCLLINGLLEVSVVAWGYGMDTFYNDLNRMLGRMPSVFFKFCWKYVIPLYLLALLLWTLISNHKQTPGTIAAYCLAFVPLLGFLCSVLYTLLQAPRASYRKRVRTLMVPNLGWTRNATQTQHPQPMQSLSPDNATCRSRHTFPAVENSSDDGSFQYQRTQTERATLTMSGDTLLTSRMGEVSGHSGPSGSPHSASQGILKKSGASRYNQVNPGTSAVE